MSVCFIWFIRLSISWPPPITHSPPVFLSICLFLWRRCALCSSRTHFYFYAIRVAGGEEVEEEEEWEMLHRRVGFLDKCVWVCVFFWGSVGGRMNEDKGSHPPLSLYLPPSLSFPGGLYGWKWGVLSATSLTQTVAPTLSEDQPERGEADHHRHCGSVPLRKAAHSPGVPHGESQCALQFCVSPGCGRLLRRRSVALLLLSCRAPSSEPGVQSCLRS